MKKGNKILIIALIIITVLVLGGVVVLYFTTDMLKTDEKLFYKYLAQVVSEDNGFIEKDIENLQNKKNQNPYENSGSFTVKTEGTETDDDINEKVNELAIKFSGKTDRANKKTEKEIIIDYGNNVTFPVIYRQVDDTVGLQIKPIGSSKFMVVKNENLKDFFTKLGVEDTTNIPDKIDFEKIEKDQEINEEDIKKIKEIYEPVIKEQLTKNNFSKVKTSDGKAYVLQLNGEQIKNLSINLLEKTKEIREEINDYLIGEEQELITAREIDNIISAIKEEDSSEIKDFKITLTQKNRKLNKIECEYGNYILTIDKVKENDKLSYNMSLAINKNQNSTDTNEKSELYWNIQYTGLQDLNKVQKKSQFGLELKMNNDNFKYEYNIDNNLEFKDNVSIDKFDDNSTVILNNYDSQVLTKFLTQVGQRISDVNKKQMEELGLEEDENPIIYSNPITSLVEIFSQGLDDTESLLDTEIEYNYEELSDGTLSIWYFDADKTHKTIEIPEEIDGKKVSQIGDSLFKGNGNVEKVVLPKSITTISPEAFCFTTSLRELEINGAVESIGVKGIYGCGELRTLRFPEGLKTLSDVSIAYCEKLTDIYLPSTVESVTSYNFALCANPLTIHVPAGSTAETVVRKAIEESESIAQSESNINIVAE